MEIRNKCKHLHDFKENLLFDSKIKLKPMGRCNINLSLHVAGLGVSIQLSLSTVIS